MNLQGNDNDTTANQNTYKPCIINWLYFIYESPTTTTSEAEKIHLKLCIDFPQYLPFLILSGVNSSCITSAVDVVLWLQRSIVIILCKRCSYIVDNGIGIACNVKYRTASYIFCYPWWLIKHDDSDFFWLQYLLKIILAVPTKQIW